MDDATVLFIDLVGSMALYDALGNARAAELVSSVTDWIGQICESAEGQVIRRLGDGVLVSFRPGASAVDCAIALQRRQAEHNAEALYGMQVQFKIGMARGLVVKSASGWVGEAINLATDLSERCGPDQILACDVALDQITLSAFARYRNLGLMHMLGKSEPVEVFQIEWKSDASNGVATVRGGLELADLTDSGAVNGIRLTWTDRQASFTRSELPIVLGRNTQAHFMVNDARVSRNHARIYELDEVLVLEDTSRYGTSVRFVSSNTVLTLRNQECVLHDDCDIAFGTSFDGSNVPKLRLSFFS